MTTAKEKIEEKANCINHQTKTNSLWNTVEGNGKSGLKDRVLKLEILIWIVIALLIGNGGLVAYSLKLISLIKK